MPTLGTWQQPLWSQRRREMSTHALFVDSLLALQNLQSALYQETLALYRNKLTSQRFGLDRMPISIYTLQNLAINASLPLQAFFLS